MHAVSAAGAQVTPACTPECKRHAWEVGPVGCHRQPLLGCIAELPTHRACASRRLRRRALPRARQSGTTVLAAVLQHPAARSLPSRSSLTRAPYSNPKAVSNLKLGPPALGVPPRPAILFVSPGWTDLRASFECWFKIGEEEVPCYSDGQWPHALREHCQPLSFKNVENRWV